MKAPRSLEIKPFRLSRRRLAAWYTGVMTLILLLCGLGVHRLVVHARWLNMVQEMQLLASTLKDYIEPNLKQFGQIDQMARQYLPGLCVPADSCPTDVDLPLGNWILSESTIFSQLEGKEYCIRFFDTNKRLVASLRYPSNNLICQEPEFWQTMRDRDGTYYHDAYYPLYIRARDSWGTMQIARSLNNLDQYLMRVEILLVVMVLLGIVLIGSASWWLSGLAMRPVSQSYQQIQQFTADAAHELRTPLASLRAIVQTALRSDQLTLEEAKESLQILNRQSYRLSKLVQDLLMLSQVDQAAPTHSLTSCCLNIIVKEVAEEFMAMAMAAEINLNTELPDQPVHILGNSEQIYCVISNLISNAIKYTPENGDVTVTLSREQSVALIQVQDTGIGIAPEDQYHIFDRFYRVNQERSSQKGGAGLGLAITQAIVQAHRGSIHVRSQLGKGSLFILRLPLLVEK